ncbi:MAG: VapB-type antitoxin [Candidatus Altiarchaeota archaeon]|nr:VapB-type antitoxin [Candidatus Altiarchaeota archaeon]
MSYITVRVDKKLKEEIEKFQDINWSEVVRQSIKERIEHEKTRQRKRTLDVKRIKKAVKAQDELSDKTSGRWSGTEEIRKWRNLL